MMSWKPAFTFRGQDAPSTNGEVYATKEEALASAHQRFMVWTMPEDLTAVETDEPVNGVWIEGQGRVTEPSGKAHMAPEQVTL
jgi:hypothetical protein